MASLLSDDGRCYPAVDKAQGGGFLKEPIREFVAVLEEAQATADGAHLRVIAPLGITPQDVPWC